MTSSTHPGLAELFNVWSHIITCLINDRAPDTNVDAAAQSTPPKADAVAVYIDELALGATEPRELEFDDVDDALEYIVSWTRLIAPEDFDIDHRLALKRSHAIEEDESSPQGPRRHKERRRCTNCDSTSGVLPAYAFGGLLLCSSCSSFRGGSLQKARR